MTYFTASLIKSTECSHCRVSLASKIDSIMFYYTSLLLSALESIQKIPQTNSPGLLWNWIASLLWKGDENLGVQEGERPVDLVGVHGGVVIGNQLSGSIGGVVCRLHRRSNFQVGDDTDSMVYKGQLIRDTYWPKGNTRGKFGTCLGDFVELRDTNRRIKRPLTWCRFEMFLFLEYLRYCTYHSWSITDVVFFPAGVLQISC